MNNYEQMTADEIKAEIGRLKKMSDDYKNEEQGVKLTLNSIYGALGNQYFACFNPEVAESVTLQGQDLIKFAEKVVNKYFHEHWHLDTELHEKIGARNVRPISAEMVIYVDTDSLEGDSKIRIRTFDNEEHIVEIQDIFYAYSKDGITIDFRGNEIVEFPKFDILNSKGESVIYSGVRKIIRHKVTKKRWKIKSSSGKSVIVTDDHSIMVFRNGSKIAVKPSEIDIKIDKILEVVDI